MEPTTASISGFLILVLPGLFFVWRGIWMLKGNSKAWYFARHLYAGSVYAQIPMGIGFLSFAAGGIFQFQGLLFPFIYIGGGFFLLGIIFNFIRPSFLKPAWLKWLERKHGDIMPILDKEAYEMGLETWEKYVDNRGLAVWVAEVRRKNGLPQKP
jgi:hypothetical protein